MTYLLDTNTCIRHLNRRSLAISQRLANIPEVEIVLCAVVKAELYFGAMKSNTPEQTILKQRLFAERFVSHPFDDDAANVYARIRADLEQAGTPIGANDLMIASIALVHDCTLVTNNLREFSRVAGLKVESWET